MGNWFDSIVMLIPTDGWQRMMVDVLWQSTFVGVLALVVSRWLVRQAAARAWVLMIALTACVFLPVTSFYVRSAGWAVPIYVGDAEFATLDSTQVGASDSLNLDQVVSDRTFMAATIRNEVSHVSHKLDRSSSNLPVPASTETATKVTFLGRVLHSNFTLITIGGVWLSSSLFQLLRLVISAIAVRRMMRLSRPCEDTVLLKALSEASQRVGLTTTPRLLVSERISAPMILAYFQPALLIPTVTAKPLGEEQFTTTFAHELAHVRRRDGWARLWVQLITALVPLQPLVWWMRSSFFEACEEACDDWAIAFGSDPVDLASVLTAWSDGNRNRRELALAVGMSGTRSRILRLLAMKDAPSAKLSVHWQFCAAMVAILLCVGLGFAQPPGLVDQAETQTQSNKEPEKAPEQPQPNDRLTHEGNQSSKAISITGTCVNDKNEPFPSARVRLFRYGHDASDTSKMTQTALQSTHCDSNGHFAFKDIARSGKAVSWIVIAQHPGWATDSTYVAAEAHGDQTLTLKIHPAATLKGRVVNEEGKSVPGAIVSVGSPLINAVPGIRAAISNADGYYEISDLRPFDLADEKPRPTGDGAYDMISQCFGQVQHSDYAHDMFPYSEIPGIANVTVQRPAIVRGRVVLKGSDSPAVGARIELWNDTIGPDSWTRATADAEGRFLIENLPPGKYRANIKLAGRPNLAVPEVALSAGSNRKDFEMERGGVVQGSVIDVSTEQPIQLAEGETVQISESDERGRWFAGMPSANIQPDGSFTLMLPAGRRFFGMYFGPNWRGVNTDRLLENGIEVIEGETIELEIRVRPRDKERPPIPKALSNGAAKSLAEQAAIAAIKQLGGWVVQETIDGKEHVVEVNMVYHKAERMGREENQLICDECLSYVQKFPKLKRLMLYREQATDAGLANLRGMDSLEGIWIWDASAVSDVGAAHLAQLNNLREIHLGNSKITDEALKHFSSLQKIKKLSLQGNHFTNKGLEYLQVTTQLTELVLGLGTNEITDDGLRFISGLTNLERLGLQSSKITDAGLQQLSSLKNLKELWVGGTKVTESGRAELRRTVPKLQ